MKRSQRKARQDDTDDELILKEAVSRRCSIQKLSLDISRNSQETPMRKSLFL